MQFARVRLENWRNFSEVDIPLASRAFLVGANASGKSNFLDVFRFLRNIVIPGGGFQEAVMRRGGVSSIRNLAARYPNTNVAVEVDIRNGDGKFWRYRLAFNQDNNRRPLIRAEKIWDRSGQIILDRPDAADDEDEARLSQTQLEQIFANRDFREITEFFQSIVYSHIVPQIIRDPERFAGQQADPFGGDFLEQIASANKNSQEARLRHIQEVLQVAIPQLSSLEIYRDARGVPHLRGKYEHWRPTGAWQTEADFSDGTLRLIGLLWALQAGEGPLLLEEPELSLHPGVVRYLPQLMQRLGRARRKGNRQLFISTHSQELLLDEAIGPEETFLLLPSREGTSIIHGASYSEIINELGSGLSIAEALMARSAPPDMNQLSLWDD